MQINVVPKPLDWQVAPFKHGLLKQGLYVWQLVPEYPEGHEHIYDIPDTVQEAPFKHGDGEHGFESMLK